jgi:hypothetical protein
MFSMKRSRFTDQQIAFALQQATGAPRNLILPMGDSKNRAIYIRKKTEIISPGKVTLS